MSMMQALLAGGGGIVNPLSGMSVTSIIASPGSTSGDITFGTDGSITGTHYSGPVKYYDPVVAGVGSNFYVKFTKNSGSAWNAGLVDGTVYALSSARTLTWSVTSGQVKTFNVTVSIYSDAGGANLVTNGTLSGDVESS